MNCNTLCWDCANAVPDLEGKRGCNWSRNRQPVEGWDAIPQLHSTRTYCYCSYEVVKCPQFVSDVKYIPIDYTKLLMTTRKGQKRIAIYRMMYGITGDRMAKDLGFSKTKLYRIENNYRTATDAEIEQIANYLAVEKSELVREKRNGKKV